MAKKTTVKKSKRKLKRTVRRSLAAILMITAIGVAAIPVPENLAADDDEVSTGSEEGIAYVKADPTTDYEAKNSITANQYAGLDIDSGEVKKAVEDGDLIQTEIVALVGNNSLSLTWEFLYEPLKNSDQNARACKYNNSFPKDTVDLALNPTKSYFAVTEAEFNKYFSADASKCDIEGGMDNLNATNKLHPTAEVVYSYDANFNPDTGAVKNMSDAVLAFFEDYFGREFQSKTEEFIAYAEAVKEDSSAQKPDPLVKTPYIDITGTTNRVRFFCEHNIVLQNTGYTLVPVVDRRINQNPNNNIYVAQGGDPSKVEGLVYEDRDGYLVEPDRRIIYAIGDRAFEGIQNVNQIDVSSNVRFIGDSAFERAGISSVVIGNANMIGNRAFAECTRLTSVNFVEPTQTNIIGAEAFYGSGISSKLSLPWTIQTIGYGAFAKCQSLTEVEFKDGISGCEIKDYAFFDDKRLSAVEFGSTVTVEYMGKGCFAVRSPGDTALQKFSFPSEGLEEIRDYVLANQQNLKEVYIQNYKKKVPVTTFYNCFNLEKVTFGADGVDVGTDSAEATFDPELFKSVMNTDFCVYGPELSAGQPANPRRCTWDAVRYDGNGVPYVFKRGDVEFYEVALESEDPVTHKKTRYRYTAGNDGELTSCALIDPSVASKVDIIIPSQIGNYSINRIGSTCFSDQTLREKINSITIQNRSISEIAAGAFRDLPNLTRVWVGDSVTNIEDNAFAGCKLLRDVYFTTPSGGYNTLSIEESAFVTKGSKLTFHGDIVEGYAPFDWAMDDQHILAGQDGVPVYVNVCYKSLWDSPNGTHLTVMRGKDGNVTLLDYPKLGDLSSANIQADYELRTFCSDMENYYYYTEYNGPEVEDMRIQYAYIFDAKQRGLSSVDWNGDGVADLTFANENDYNDELNKRYGPWINPAYCEPGYWKSYLDTPESGETTAGARVLDFLLEPIVAEAAANPTPYFDGANRYDFMKNYESYLNDPNYGDLPDYRQVPEKAWNYIKAVQEVIVPAGIKSIDAKNYFTQNGDNYTAYFKNDLSYEVRTMYMTGTHGSEPGLFSGYYEDYDSGDSRETNPVGNDTIRKITLTDVEKLPNYAFDSCEQLTEVSLGNVKEIGELPFRGCPNLTLLTGSAKYPAQNGILYEELTEPEGKYKIVECLLSRGQYGTGNPDLENAAIGPEWDSRINDVVLIDPSAFEDCTGISTVDLSGAEGLKKIEKETFKNCDQLKDIKLPPSVNEIEDDAFSGALDRWNIYIPGREVDISDIAFDPKEQVTIWTYEDSAAYRYGKREGIRVELLTAYRVLFRDYDGTQVGTVQTVGDETGFRAVEPVEAAALKEADHRLGYTFNGWKSTGGKTIEDRITDDMTIFVAQYVADGTLVNGMCEVEFLDGIDGSSLGIVGEVSSNGKYYLLPGESFASKGWSMPEPKVHDGYEFKEWSNGWTLNTEFEKRTTIVALYREISTSGGSTNTSGGSTTTSRNTTSSNSGSNTSRNSTSSTSSSSTSSSSTSSSSTSTSSTTSGSASEKALYTVTVINGNGSGTYAQGTTVVISANEPAAGMTFQKWTTESNGVTLASVSLPATTFTMPAGNVTVTANYVAATAANTATPTSTGGNSGGGGSTRVDITKPGISNKDLATANANGTTDNFIVKITETDEATRAVSDALANKYGSLDNILYYAMDISLWDSTGTYQLSGDQLNGITVDITIPIPDALVAYGGNNMAGAVVNGNQLENLNENFTTINGVPCIKFTASHFSPYTVYVDTGNLTEGMLDTTPKTGDPIHPKWFLSIGLACLSIILFMKKDKSAKVKTA